MTRWLLSLMVSGLIGLTLLALAQNAPEPKSGVYVCSAVQSPTLLQLEGVGTVRLIGVQVTENTPQFDKAMALVKQWAEGKLVRIDVCPKMPKDSAGNVRAEVFYTERGQWRSINRQLLAQGVAQLVPEANCHIDFVAWRKALTVSQPQPRLRQPRTHHPAPVRRERREAPLSLRAVPRVRRVVSQPTHPIPLEAAKELGMRTVSVAALRPSLQQAEQRVAQAAANLSAWREIQWRVETLQRAMLPIAARARLSLNRFSQLVLRGTPSPLIANELNPVLAPLPGEPMPQRIIRLGLTNRRETLSQVLNWFPELRTTLLQRLQALGAQLVGGTPVATGGTPGAGGAPGMMGAPGMPGAPGMMGGPPMMGPPGMMAPGAAPPGAPGAPPMAGPEAMGEMAGSSMPGAPGMPGAMGAPGAPAAGGATNFYRYLELARNRMIDPEFAAVCVLALEAYREQVNSQVNLAAAEYRRAREEWAEIHEIVERELRKLARTPLNR